MKKPNPKSIPQFKSEDEEREFWATHDTTEYFDVEHPIALQFPNLKPTTTTISLRLPYTLLYSIKEMANKRDVPYQSLIKILLAEKMQEETKPSPRL